MIPRGILQKRNKKSWCSTDKSNYYPLLFGYVLCDNKLKVSKLRSEPKFFFFFFFFLQKDVGLNAAA